MFANKIVRWVPLITILICLMLIATVVSAQPYGRAGDGQGKGQGPGMGGGQFGPGMHGGPQGPGMQGPGMQGGPQGPGMGPQGPGWGPGEMGGREIMGHLIGPGGPFADPKVEQLMADIKILGFINRFEFTDDQLQKIAGLSKEARSTASRMVDEVRGIMIPRLQETRDALMRGEKPERKEKEERAGIPEDMKDIGKDTKQALDKITDKFFDLLTDEQKAMMKQGPGFGQGPGPMGPGQFQQDQGQFRQDRQNWDKKNKGDRRIEDGTDGSNPPEALDKPPVTDDEQGTGEQDNQDEQAANRKFKEKKQQKDGGGYPGMGQGPGMQGPGGQGPFGGPGMGDPEQMLRMRVLELLLDPRTADVITEKLHYM